MSEFFNAVVDKYYLHKGSWRYGQTLMNVLYDTDLELYMEIVDTDKDCFYDDDVACETLKFIGEKWNV